VSAADGVRASADGPRANRVATSMPKHARAITRGRPWPDLPLIALLKLRGGAVSELAVVGDTASDIESGLRAGAAIVAGVLTGASSRADLERAGAPLILDAIADILPYVTG
jgi:phosphoglycolate phosphatase-like HAD superfamily hydrolase